MREEPVRQKWSNMITESVEQISKAIEKLRSKENHESNLTADEMAWAILSLENGMAIFSYISEDCVPLHLYGKALQNLFLSPS
jgi:archaellum component FlaC